MACLDKSVQGAGGTTCRAKANWSIIRSVGSAGHNRCFCESRHNWSDRYRSIIREINRTGFFVETD